MAIDSTLFHATIPAGSYTPGQKITLSVVRGPAVVRDGYGAAKMKRIFVVQNGTGAQTFGFVKLKNSNWIDSMGNFAVNASSAYTSMLADNSPAIQRCGDIELQPNSTWSVEYEVLNTVTTTDPFDVFALIDIDYPSVNAVANPKEQTGAPVTLMETYTVTPTVIGNAPSWSEFNVDVFKAGYRYLLAQVGARGGGNGVQMGFFSIHGAAGQAGLERLIPIAPGSIVALRYGLDYSTPLVKGPMTVSFCTYATTATPDPLYLEADYIRR